MELRSLKVDVKVGEEVKLFFVGDLHRSHVNFDKLAFIKARDNIINACEKTKCIVFFMGDADCFIVNQKDRRFNPVELDRMIRLHDLKNMAMYQCNQIVDLMQPIADKAFKIYSVYGNHEEEYIHRHAVDVVENYSDRLGMERLGAMGAVKLTLNNSDHSYQYIIGVAHGHSITKSSAKLPGTVMRRCLDIFGKYLFDISVIGHYHKMEDTRDLFRSVNSKGTKFVENPRIFASSGTFLRDIVLGNRSYGETIGGKGVDIGYCEATLSIRRNNRCGDIIKTEFRKVYL